MGFEGFADKQDKERKERSETERKREIAERMAFEKEKAAAAAEREKRRKLQMLKSGVERGAIRPEAARDAASDLADQPDVAEILTAIESVENVPDVDALLPRPLRLTRQEYLRAVASPDDRKAAIKKVDAALARLRDAVKTPAGPVMTALSLAKRGLSATPDARGTAGPRGRSS